MEFPYGKAPLAILLLAVLMCIMLGSIGVTEEVQVKPDLVYATFSKEHAEIYRNALPAFEKANNCHIQIQLVDQRALQNRLESAMEAGADVPDMVEILDGTLGVFTKGPIEDVGFTDLTEKVHQTGLYDKIVQSRFIKWSSRGHIFALPHDVHPGTLCYRADLVKQMGIDVDKLTTWDEFAKVGREVVKNSTDKNGIIKHYMIDLPADGSDSLKLLLLQNGGRLIDENGQAAFDSDAALETVLWYVHATQGKDRFSFPCGWGQTLAKAMTDGLCLFYVCPDWRTAQFQADEPNLSGKLKLMKLPAWQPGGIRTSTWGGTGLTFPKTCRNFDLAWKLAMYFYYVPEQLGPRFEKMNILPPLKDAWTQPEFSYPRPFFSGQPIGKLFIELAPQVPSETVSPYITDARDKFSESYSDCTLYYQDHGDDGLREYAKADLKRCADQVRVIINRNVFLSGPQGVAKAVQEEESNKK
jgi:arabinosaccharide transport system substrate-binding protein